MKQHWQISLKVLALTCLALLVFASCAPAGSPAEGEKSIKVGVSLVLTGPVATSGAAISWGMVDYLKYLNEQLGGIEYHTPEGKVDHIKLDFVWEDNAYSVPKTLSIYKRQKAAGVGLMAILGSTPGEAIVVMASRDQIPVIGFAASASPVNMGAKPNYYMASMGSVADQAGVIMKWFAETWKQPRRPKVGVIFGDVPSLRPVAYPEGTPAYAARLGMDWVGAEFIPTATTDTTIELTRLAANGADLIVIENDHIALDLDIPEDYERLKIQKSIPVFNLFIGTTRKGKNHDR